jgi:hypothetical protein
VLRKSWSKFECCGSKWRLQKFHIHLVSCVLMWHNLITILCRNITELPNGTVVWNLGCGSLNASQYTVSDIGYVLNMPQACVMSFIMITNSVVVSGIVCVVTFGFYCSNFLTLHVRMWSFIWDWWTCVYIQYCFF